MMKPSALAHLFAICVLSAAMESVAGEDAYGIRAMCGLSIALAAVRFALGILG